MRTKIIEMYNSNFSSHTEINEEEIAFIIAHDCKCGRCGKSIFEMYDFPELLIDDDEIMCENCYDENYREICPICEESYDVKDFKSDYFVLSEEGAKEVGKKPGIYKILKRPFYLASIISGFESFFDESIELVVSININHFKEIEVGIGFQEVDSDTICPDCVEKYVRKDNYLKAGGRPCILMKKYENNKLFADYTLEEMHKTRQRIIHTRITTRGILQAANNQ